MATDFEGLEEVMERLEKLADTSTIEKALGKACLVVEAAAKKNAPKGTGELRNSISSRVERTSDGVEGIVFTPLEYAPYVEYGTGLFAESGGRTDVPWNYQDDEGEWHSTSGMKPRPYMRPAIEESREQVIKILEESILND